MIKYFFSRDLLNYARLMPVHLAEMNNLEQDDPVTWQVLISGEFVVSKNEVPFTSLFTDQTLEQEIQKLKHHGGIVGLGQDEAALDRLITITPHLANIVKQYLNSFPRAAKKVSKKEHHQLTGNCAFRIKTNAIKLRDSMEMHCTGDPFIDKFPLKRLVSSAIVPTEAKNDIINFAQKGQVQFEQFVETRLLSLNHIYNRRQGVFGNNLMNISLSIFMNLLINLCGFF